MSNKILVDTDIVIDVGVGIINAIDRIQQESQSSILAISIITQMELLVGCRNKTELQKLESFLTHYQIIKLEGHISEKALDLIKTYRLSHGLLIPDALIAATAIIESIPLLTKNQKDYRFIQELNLLNYS